MNKVLLLLLIAITTMSCSTHQNSVTKKEAYLKELVSMMQGHYSSEKQSIVDTTYYNISLRMTPIWKQRGHYLSVEQALSTKLDKPYRVRIYKITQRSENEFISEIYTLKNEKEWIGKWKTPDAFDSLTDKDIELKPGCGVVLKRIEKNKFTGSTGEKTCPSKLGGASYASSKVTVLPNEIISWDQGFDTDGKQVWGAEKAGYVFEKIK